MAAAAGPCAIWRWVRLGRCHAPLVACADGRRLMWRRRFSFGRGALISRHQHNLVVRLSSRSFVQPGYACWRPESGPVGPRPAVQYIAFCPPVTAAVRQLLVDPTYRSLQLSSMARAQFSHVRCAASVKRLGPSGGVVCMCLWPARAPACVSHASLLELWLRPAAVRWSMSGLRRACYNHVNRAPRWGP